ncbi:MAG: hypothetical protein KDE48_12340 [Anaerolineales bacterium]|nr:hypothetical protein [Anaerolineales bacterium]
MQNDGVLMTDSQAVQFSMIVLLASIFFSGFFIALHRLVDAVHIVSWRLRHLMARE